MIFTGEADESDDENVVSLPISPQQSIDKDSITVKYDHSESFNGKSICTKSLFHSNLNNEMKAFVKNLQKFTDTLYDQTKLSINMMQTQLMMTYSMIQNVSYHLRISSNDLFYLEDNIDLINDYSNKFPKFDVN